MIITCKKIPNHLLCEPTAWDPLPLVNHFIHHMGTNQRSRSEDAKFDLYCIEKCGM